MIEDYERRILVKVLIDHQRKDIGSCICGWGVNSGHLGKSHAEHVANEYERTRGV